MIRRSLLERYEKSPRRKSVMDVPPPLIPSKNLWNFELYNPYNQKKGEKFIGNSSFFIVNEELMKMPRINILEKPNKMFWQEISKDIISPFAPSNKTLLLHLARKKSLNIIPQMIPNKIIKPMISFNQKNSSRIIIKNLRNHSYEIDSFPFEELGGGHIHRKSCNGALFGFESFFQKKANCLPFKFKSHKLFDKIKSSPATQLKLSYKRNSISICAIVKTKKIFQAHKKSAQIRNENKKSTILINYDNSSKIWNRSSLLSGESHKSSIGKFIDYSKNSIISLKETSPDLTKIELNEKSNSNFDTYQINMRSKYLNQTSFYNEGPKLGKKGSLLQKLLQNNVNTNSLLPKNQNSDKNLNLEQYCKKMKYTKSFDFNCREKESKLNEMNEKKFEKSILSIYANHNLNIPSVFHKEKHKENHENNKGTTKLRKLKNFSLHSKKS